MSRWFRHYAGMMRDEKLVRAAIKSGQPIERVVWVWGAILESAAEIDDNGRYEIDNAEMAWFLRVDERDLVSIQSALEALGRVSGGNVARWGDRQFLSDRSAERQRRYRERHQTPVRDGGDAAVTSPSRHGDAPETETDTETEKKEVARARRASRLPEDWHLTNELEDYALGKGIPMDKIAEEVEGFRDHWNSKSGKDAAKLDWPAAWRTWVKRSCEWKGYKPPVSGGRPAEAVEFVCTHDPRWPLLAERYAREHGKPPPTMSGVGGPGRHFPQSWLVAASHKSEAA